MANHEDQIKRASERDRGLRRVSNVKRLMVVSVVALTVGLSAVAAQAVPGGSERRVVRPSQGQVKVALVRGPMAPDPIADDPATSKLVDPKSTQSDPAPSESLQPPSEPPTQAPVDQSGGTVSGGS